MFSVLGVRGLGFRGVGVGASTVDEKNPALP